MIELESGETLAGVRSSDHVATYANILITETHHYQAKYVAIHHFESFQIHV